MIENGARDRGCDLLSISGADEDVSKIYKNC